MQVSQERLERILEVYKPECRYLKKAELDLLKATGTFEVGDTFYTTEPVEHLAAAEAEICLNQLAYVAFAEWIDRGEFEGIELEFEEFLGLMKEKMYITDLSAKFREPISKDQMFKLEMQFVNEKIIGNARIARLRYSFADGKAAGEIYFALTLDKESQ